MLLVKTFLQLFLIVLVQSDEDVSTTTATPILYVNENNIIWSPKYNQEVVIECDLGYQLVATVQECNIDGEHNEFATLSTGRVNESLMFTYTLANNPTYFFNTNQLYASFNGTESSKFIMIFSRVGNGIISTTTELTTSTMHLPTPMANESSEIEVYLTGRNPYEYRNPDVLNSLIQMIREMAEAYCRDQNFELKENITTDNVEINEILECTSRIYNCDSCVQVRFAIPVNLAEESQNWKGYQLNSDHLQIMWNRYSPEYIKDGFINCQKNNIDKWISSQVIVMATSTVIFLAALLGMKYYAEKITKKLARNKRKEKRGSPIPEANDSNRFSLTPHHLQDIPSLFDNMYPMYNPELGADNDAFEHFENVPEDEFTIFSNENAGEPEESVS